MTAYLRALESVRDQMTVVDSFSGGRPMKITEHTSFKDAKDFIKERTGADMTGQIIADDLLNIVNAMLVVEAETDKRLKKLEDSVWYLTEFSREF